MDNTLTSLVHSAQYFFPALKSAVRSRTPLLTKVSSVATYFLVVVAGRERQEG